MLILQIVNKYRHYDTSVLPQEIAKRLLILKARLSARMELKSRDVPRKGRSMPGALRKLSG